VTDVRVLLASPPVTVFGPELPVEDSLLRYKLGRAVELARARRVLALGEPGALEALLDGLADAKRLAVLPLPLRRRVTELLAAAPRDTLDLAGYRAACHRAADRSGLVASGDPAEVLAAHPLAAAHLMRFAASRAYRRALRTVRAKREPASTAARRPPTQSPRL